MVETLTRPASPDQGRDEQLDFLDTQIEYREIFLAGRPHWCAVHVENPDDILTSSPIGEEGVTDLQRKNVREDGRRTLELRLGMGQW